MNHDDHRKLQQEILAQVLFLLKNDQNVLGCVFSGSYARGEQDAFSDLDIANPSYVYQDAVIEYDPDGKLRQGLPKAQSLPPAEHPKWFEPGDPAMIDWFFWMFRQVVCWAKRGAQKDYRSYDKLANAVNSLAEIRSRLIEMRLWTLGIKDYLVRADPDCASRMAKTYPHLQADEIIQCARGLLAEYENLCPGYCQKAGAIYPARKVEIMYRLIEEFEGLE